MNKCFKSWHYLLALIAIHIVLWTVTPLSVRTVLPLDTIEGLTWGHAWQWGYDKNPYLNAWVSEIFAYFGGASGWALYLASTLCVAICFLSIYRLAKKFFSEHVAIATAFLIEGIYYMNITSPQFNDNMLEVALWPLTVLFFYRALKDQRIYDWLLVGLFAGLSFVTKYLAVIVIALMGLFILINPKARQSLTKKGLYLAFLPFLMLSLPHIIWLFQHDFITLHYAFHRAESKSALSSHIIYAAKFTAEQALALLPSLLLSLWFTSRFDSPKSFVIAHAHKPLSRYEQQFLMMLCAGPLCFLVLLSMIKGYALEPLWGVPLLAPFTIIITALWRPQLTHFRFMGLISTTLGLLFAATLGYAVSILNAPSSSCSATAYYPGQAIASYATDLWHREYKTPLAIVAGPRWLAGNIAFYSKDRPQVYMEYNPNVSTWLNDQDLKSRGALFLWEIKNEKTTDVPDELLARFPHLIVLPAQSFGISACVQHIGMAALKAEDISPLSSSAQNAQDNQ